VVETRQRSHVVHDHLNALGSATVNGFAIDLEFVCGGVGLPLSGRRRGRRGRTETDAVVIRES
jgi:hypothetical protein